MTVKEIGIRLREIALESRNIGPALLIIPVETREGGRGRGKGRKSAIDANAR